MRKALAVVLPFISVPPMCLGTYGMFMGALPEPPGGPILIGLSCLGVLIGSGLCLTVYAASCHDQK
jgi:hypothetical protein